MKKQIIPIISFFLLLPFLVTAQSGGDGTYQFLNLVTSARVAGMGGLTPAIKDNDISLAWNNPSLITVKMNNSLLLNFVNYYSGVNYGAAAYSRTFKKYGSFTGGINFIDYGTFTRADATGETAGTFHAGEYALQVGWGRELDSNFSIGANLKTVISNLESQSSFGIGVDVAGTYNVPQRDLTVSLLVRDVGRQLIAYRNGNNEPFPFTMELGVSKKLKHLPFRYSIVYQNIEKFDLTYKDPLTDKPTVDPLTGEAIKKDNAGDFFDKLGRHFVLGGEFVPSKNFSIRLGYNYLRRKELGVDTKMSTVGFSWGFGFRVKQFQFNYSRSTYHLSGSPNYISIVTDLSTWVR